MISICQENLPEKYMEKIDKLVMARLLGEEIEIDDYDAIATLRGHDVLFFRRCGSYQGLWIMLSKHDDEYFLWKDWYGSCSGCDSLEAAEPRTPEAVLDFIERYAPFLQAPKASYYEAVLRGELRSLLPLNDLKEIEEEFDDGNFVEKLESLIRHDYESERR